MSHLWYSAASLFGAYTAALLVFLLARRFPALIPFRGAYARLQPGTVRRAGDVIFLVLAAGYVVLFLALSSMRFEALQNRSAQDTALFTQTLWNASAGRLFQASVIDSTGDLNGYFMPLILALVPLYTIASEPHTLLVLQTLALAAAAFPVYWTARRELGTPLALAIAVAFFLSPSLHNVNLSGFHIIALAAPLLSFATFFLLRRDYRAFFACAVPLWLVKEEASLLLIGAGAFIFLVQRKWKLGLAVAAFGVVGMVVLLTYIVPALTGKPYFVGRGYYTAYGSSLPEILTSFVTRPQIVLATLSQPVKIEYVADLLVPLALVPLAGFDVILISAVVWFGLLVTNPNQAGIGGQYTATIFPTFFFAAIVGFKRLLAWRATRPSGAGPALQVDRMLPHRLAAGTLVVAAALAGYWTLSPGPFSRDYDASLYNVTPQTLAINDLIAQVPRDATVAAQEELIVHFANRRSAFMFPGIPYYRADYVVLDKARPFYNVHKQAVDAWLGTGYFDILSDANDFILAKRKPASTPVGVRFGNSMTLLAYTLVPAQATFNGTETVAPIVAWRADGEIKTRYVMQVRLVDPGGHVVAQYAREPQNGSLPTNRWVPGEPVNDQYVLPLSPAFMGGDYAIQLQVLDPETGSVPAQTVADGRALATPVVLATVHLEKNTSNFIASQLDIENRAMADFREIRLIGYTALPATAPHGSTLPVGLYWRARQKPQGDYSVAVQLRDAGGRVMFEQASRPAGGAYPTTRWNEGEVALDWHDVPLDVAPGAYEVSIDVRDPGNLSLGQSSLATVTITP